MRQTPGGYHAIKFGDQTKPPKVTGSKKPKCKTIVRDCSTYHHLKPLYSDRKQTVKRWEP
ncbi:hypothetical protein COCC4DRAFT_29712 [Bipolaris maydis ATCC 48331]|uniref:Uncharacterized protein n=2 Tax=Cochliobolus heterostrophus TaxID=5016 RepID=M2UQ46_COCH5|nr:uncharacterized protein COCC4DRAFT_29712 [Bipolaris maydis ATCC 48331]EMD90017.1 hypothetical protein COCHEDRAFT_1022131 [Bipolaris maydis C5]ENI09769.1 hypothetical protein COCC4DRAFT_29712 [Bipolaris maydis ATCC 48331]